MSDEPNATILDSVNLIGQVVSDRYEVKEVLGEGSMGIVFLAEHTHMKKKVALKVMRAEFLANPEAVERFQREAQASGHIDHQHVCAATDFGRLDDERFFLVMEHLEGRTLGRLLDAEERLLPERAVKVARQIAQGLQRAHELEIVHRDLKPDNIFLIEREGDADFVKIMDFGVARVEVVDAQNLTRAGTTMGTPVYMSPEQAVAKRADARSDLYTLGVMLFEMLTGQVPFYSESLAVILSKHANEPPPPMHEVAPDALVPEALCDIVDRLLDKNPDARFQTAAELIEALEAADLAPYVPGLSSQSSELAAALGELSEPSGPVADTQADAKPPSVSQSDIFGSEESVAPPTDGEWVPPGKPEALPSGPGLATRFAEAPPAVRYGLVFAMLLVLAAPLVAVLVVASGADDGAVSPDGEDESGMSFSEDDVKPADLESERKELFDDLDIAEKVASASPADTAAIIEPLLKGEHEHNAHLRFALGAAQVDAGSAEKAMPHYADAVKADARYAQDGRILSDAQKSFTVKSESESAAAKAVLLALLASPNPQAIEGAVLEIAFEGTWGDRKRARDLLKESKRWDGLAAWQRDAVDLGLVGKDCKVLLKHVRSLAKSGEAGALPALRKAARRPKEGCGFLNKQDCYRCARQEIDATIKKLEKLEKAPPAPPSAPAEPATE